MGTLTPIILSIFIYLINIPVCNQSHIDAAILFLHKRLPNHGQVLKPYARVSSLHVLLILSGTDYPFLATHLPTWMSCHLVRV